MLWFRKFYWVSYSVRFLSAFERPTILLLATLLAVPAYGYDNGDYAKLNISYAVTYRGQCTMMPAVTGQAQTGTCKGMSILVYKNGRVQYLFMYDEDGYTKLVVFSGGVDRQPVLSHYELDIDAVIINETKVAAPIRMAAKGLCTMDGDPNAVATFRCAAVFSEPHAPARRFEFVFESEGVEIYAASASP